jgi:hypothetical protein
MNFYNLLCIRKPPSFTPLTFPYHLITSKAMEIITLYLSFCICLSCPGSISNQVMMVALLGFSYSLPSNYLTSSILFHSVTEYAISNFTSGFVSLS